MCGVMGGGGGGVGGTFSASLFRDGVHVLFCLALRFSANLLEYRRPLHSVKNETTYELSMIVVIRHGTWPLANNKLIEFIYAVIQCNSLIYAKNH